MTAKILSVGNSLAVFFFVISIFLTFVGSGSFVQVFVKLGLYTLLLTPVSRLIFVGWEASRAKDHQARKWMVMVVLMLLAFSMWLGIHG